MCEVGRGGGGHTPAPFGSNVWGVAHFAPRSLSPYYPLAMCATSHHWSLLMVRAWFCVVPPPPPSPSLPLLGHLQVASAGLASRARCTLPVPLPTLTAPPQRRGATGENTGRGGLSSGRTSWCWEVREGCASCVFIALMCTRCECDVFACVCSPMLLRVATCRTVYGSGPDFLNSTCTLWARHCQPPFVC
jgi:hypothetical protein